MGKKRKGTARRADHRPLQMSPWRRIREVDRSPVPRDVFPEKSSIILRSQNKHGETWVIRHVSPFWLENEEGPVQWCHQFICYARKRTFAYLGAGITLEGWVFSAAIIFSFKIRTSIREDMYMYTWVSEKVAEFYGNKNL